MNALRELRRKAPWNLLGMIVCVCLLPATVSQLFAVTTIRFLWFFISFALAVLLVYQLISACVRLGIAVRTMKVIRWVIRIGVLVWLISLVVLIGFCVAKARPETGENVPYIVVLGAGLNGEEPSLILQRRLDVAAELSRREPQAKLILCGGQGPKYTISEAEAMRRYLTEKGVDPERLLLEDVSRDTAENLRNASELLRSLDGQQTHDAYLVTCEFHMMRSKMLAERSGIHAYAAPAKTRPQEYHFYLREYCSMVIYLIELTGITIDTSVLNL